MPLQLCESRNHPIRKLETSSTSHAHDTEKHMLHLLASQQDCAHWYTAKQHTVLMLEASLSNLYMANAHYSMLCTHERFIRHCFTVENSSHY